LWTYARWGSVQSLPAGVGGGSPRDRLERALAEWTPARASLVGLALWDTSLRVRRRALEVLPALPDEAAPALLSILLLAGSGERNRSEHADLALRRVAAERPSWVAGAAEAFCHDDLVVARWLTGLGPPSDAAARRAVPRMHAMLRRLDLAGASRRYQAVGLRRALSAFGESPADAAGAPLEDETITELLTKLGERRRA
jgi:hypothetical protein